MRVLKELELDERTLVIWTSDNGAVGWDPPQGSNAPLRGWGYSTSEGGQRMPCIARWPGRIPAGVVRDDLTTMMDILPTVVRLAVTEPPDDRIIDGQDIRPILFDESGSGSAYDEIGFFYYHMQQLQAVRSGPWKLYLPLDEKLSNLRGIVEGCEPADAELYDVRNDLGETKEVSAEYPEVVERLMALAERAREDLGDWDREGANQREAGWVDDPRPQVLLE